MRLARLPLLIAALLGAALWVGGAFEQVPPAPQIRQDELPPPEGDEVYLHELEGFSVRLADGTPLGLVSGVYELPAGLMIEDLA